MFATFPRLLGDIGGTNARFAWQAEAGAPISDVAALPTDRHASIEMAVRHYLALHHHPAPRACAFGIATTVAGDRVQMTNHPWQFSIAALQAEMGLERLVVINDFTALALGLPSLGAHELHPVGGGEAVAGAPRAVLGPGTGLGVAAAGATIAWSTDVPRSVGLAGSSALAVAVIDAYAAHVGVALDRTGALLVADDVGNVVWRVTPADRP